MPAKANRHRMLVVAILFGLTIFFLLWIAYSSGRSRETLFQAYHEIERDQQVRNLISLIRQHTVAAETAERGFLITGEVDYLDPFEQALALRSKKMEDLEELSAALPGIAALIPDLKLLIRDRDEELEAAIALRRANNFDETVQAVRDGLRRNLSERIRQVLGQMEGLIDEALAEAEAEYRNQIDEATLIMNLAAYLSLALGVLGLIFLVGHLRDQIRTIQLERDKKEAERMAHEKSRFLASMNHEIRTPLNALLGFSELLDTEVTSVRGRRYLSAIRTSGSTLADLINDILDLSRIESGILELAPGPVNVREFAKGIQILFEEQAHAKGLLFEFVVDEDCPAVLIFDPLRVRQVLVNLLGNALKFTAAGSIRGFIWAREVEEGRCELAFSVQDTGRGIAPDKMAIIFQPFRQAETSDEMLGGTGLGLSICHELAMLMGGEIEVTSEVGVGTEFLLILHRVEIVTISGAVPDESTVATHFDDLPPCRILVVDDNPFNIELIAGFFEETHHKLDYAENGLEALESMKRNIPDIVLMDIRMPVMSGDEARIIMQEDERLASIPVIAVTASTLTSQEQRLRELFDGYLRKPFTRAGLFQGMKAVLSRRDARLRGRAGRRDGRVSDKVIPISTPQVEEAGTQRGHGAGNRERLITELEALKEKRWPLLMRAMLLSDVASAADELGDIAERYGEGDLEEYAREISVAVEQINQPRIEELLQRFDLLIERLS